MYFVTFLGTRSTGKSHIALHTARVLTNAGKKVLVIDLTQDQGMYFYFNYNDEVEQHLNLNNLNPITREGIDILVNDPLKSDAVNFDRVMKEFDLTGYDCILVEIDEMVQTDWIFDSDRFFLIQPFEKDKLKRNIQFVTSLVRRTNKKIGFNLIYNMAMPCKLKPEYINESYMQIDRTILYGGKQFEIPYNDMDIVLSNSSKVEGRLNAGKYSKEHKQAIFEIANHIVPLAEYKSFKKLIS